MDEQVYMEEATALAREAEPEASLTELAAMMEPPITKPAMNHRLKKLCALGLLAVLAVTFLLHTVMTTLSPFLTFLLAEMLCLITLPSATASLFA